MSLANLNLSVVDGALVIGPAVAPEKSLTAADFADKPLIVVAPTEPGFYVALNAEGRIERVVSVSVEDRMTAAALVGNWITQGFRVEFCSLAALLKQLRKLAAASKPVAPEAGASEEPAI